MHKTELDPNIGKLLNNRYLIRDLIGKGGMGRVYLAEDTAKAGMPVAVKLLSLSLGNQQLSQRFAREIFICSQLGRKSNHIVRVLSYGVNEDKIPFYVMEYLQGKNLKEVINGQPLSLPKFFKFCQQICLGLQCAHQGISLKGEIYPVIHQDIKPENIFISQDYRQEETIKILDFGIAKFLCDRAGMTLSNSSSFIGSLPYCSPEHVEGRKQLDIRSDIYSLGVLMFEMLTGQKPLQAKTTSFGSWYQAHRFQTPRSFEEVAPNIKLPEELKKLVMRCLAKEARDRPQNLSEILHILEIVKLQLDGDNGNCSSCSQSPSKTQLVPLTSLSEEACRQKIWPRNKPVAPIVFPHLLSTKQGRATTLWAMMPKQEIQKCLEKISDTEFLASLGSYPMLLWVTVLYGVNNYPTRWFSYFLDLKDARGQQIVRILAETGFYHLLFFAIEEPTQCAHVMTLNLTVSQRQQLTDWLEFGQKSNFFGDANETKIMLKAEYEKIKPEILQKLAANDKPNKVGVKNWLSNLLNNFLNLLPRP